MSNKAPLTTNAPDDRSSLWAALSAMMRNAELQSENLLPAKVISFDRANNVATVQPLIMIVTTTDATIARNPYVKIPCLSLGGGGFHISFPLAAGDLGWIYASDRDISLFMQSLQQTAPNTGRAHRFEDGMFIPDVFRNYTIAGEDSGAMVMQHTASDTRIAVDAAQIRMTIGSTKIVADGSSVTVTASASYTWNVPTNTFNGNVIINGNTTMNGSISQTGGSNTATFAAPTTFSAASTFNNGFTSATNVTINGRSFMGHQHTDPQGGNTGGVV